MPIELSEADVQALRNLGPALEEIKAELDRAERANINVTRLKQSFQTVVKQHAGLIQHYVEPQQPTRRRTA